MEPTRFTPATAGSPVERSRAEVEVQHGAPANGNGHGNGHEEEIDLNVPKPRPVWVVAAGLAAAAALAGLLVTGLIPRHGQTRDLNADAADAMNAPVVVNVVRPKRAPAEVTISIPGTLRPWQEVSIFARTTGYLKDYKVDISEHVEKGSLMAEIDTPEIDAELRQDQAAQAQANAALNKAKTERKLTKATLDRFLSLQATHSVSAQDIDEKQSAYETAEANLKSAEANVTAAEANVKRLMELQSFEKVMAPFSGVVTGRAFDRGSLIIANPTAVEIKPLFKIAQNDVLRAFVNVPQSSALQIKKGMKVKVTVRERPGQIYDGVVMGTTNYLDPMNRSLLTEVKLPNPKEADGRYSLLPGMFIDASFTVTRDVPPLRIPGPAIVNNAEGMQVAVVREGKAHFVKITPGQDYGSEVEVVGGLNGDERIIANPGERTVEGAAVTAAGAENVAAEETKPVGMAEAGKK